MSNPGLQGLIDNILQAGHAFRRIKENFPYIGALVWDAYASQGVFLTDKELMQRISKGHEAYLHLLVSAIVPKLRCQTPRDKLDTLYLKTLPELARLSHADRWLSEPEGSEELARLVLNDLQILPEGETAEAASKRLQSVSILERRRLMEFSRASEQRAREVREALAFQAAREAADKYSRD